MKLIILIVPGLVLVGMMMYFQSNGGKELDSYIKKYGQLLQVVLQYLLY